MTLFRQTSFAAIAGLVLTGSRFALAAIVARRLSSVGFGQFVYAQWLVDIAFLICSLGATGAVCRYAAEYRGDPAKLSAFIQRWRPWALGLPGLSGGAVLIGAWLSGFKLDLSATVFLGLWAVAGAGWAMQTAALTGFQRFDLIFYANLTAAGTMLIGAIVLPISTDMPAVLFGLMATAAGIATIVGFSETRRFKALTKVSIGADEWQTIRRYAMNMWLIALLWALLWSRGELPLVKSFLGDAGVAHYAAVLTLFGGAMQGVMLGMSAVAPELTRLWGSACRDEALALARHVMDLQLLVCGGAAVVLICLGSELLALVFGAIYRKEAVPLAILSVGLVSLTLSTQNHLLQIATDGRFNRNASLVGLLFLMALAYALVPQFGIEGAALARAATMLTLALVSIIAVRRIWRATSLSLQNFSAVIAIVGLCLVFVMHLSIGSFLPRLGVLLGSIVLVAMVVRDVDGVPTVLAIALPLWRRLIARFGEASQLHSGRG